MCSVFKKKQWKNKPKTKEKWLPMGEGREQSTSVNLPCHIGLTLEPCKYLI